MEHTEGRGKVADVWVDGHLLAVCDGVSDGRRRCEPGLLEEVRFSYMADEPVAWERATRANPGKKRVLSPVRRWSYMGYGRVVSVAPVVIDFGLLRMEDANWTTDESLIGRFVRVPVDRLEIAPAAVEDWPEGL